MKSSTLVLALALSLTCAPMLAAHADEHEPPTPDEWCRANAVQTLLCVAGAFFVLPVVIGEALEARCVAGGNAWYQSPWPEGATNAIPAYPNQPTCVPNIVTTQG